MHKMQPSYVFPCILCLHKMQPSKMVAFYAENATIVDGIKCKVAFYAEDANISLHCMLHFMQAEDA
jgi:hypothetical protein